MSTPPRTLGWFLRCRLLTPLWIWLLSEERTCLRWWRRRRFVWGRWGRGGLPVTIQVNDLKGLSPMRRVRNNGGPRVRGRVPLPDRHVVGRGLWGVGLVRWRWLYVPRRMGAKHLGTTSRGAWWRRGLVHRGWGWGRTTALPSPRISKQSVVGWGLPGHAMWQGTCRQLKGALCRRGRGACVRHPWGNHVTWWHPIWGGGVWAPPAGGRP